MERRVLLAVALSILVLFSFRYFQERHVGARAPARPAAKEQPAAAEVPPAAVPSAVPAEQGEAVPSAEDTVAAAEPLVIEGDLYRAILDNRGAVISSWQLKKYRSGKGEIFEMIAGGHDPESRPYPGSLILENPALTKAANSDPYLVEVVEGARSGSTISAPAAITLKLTRGDLSIEKRYRFL
ncbi:MAG: rane protein, partial [Acidobacteria bacterium]|nr:rane protein [Acidobacteriota bacterium]